MAIEIVSFPIQNGGFHSYVRLPEGNNHQYKLEITITIGMHKLGYGATFSLYNHS